MCMCVALILHMLHALQQTTWEFIMFILVLSNMQHKAVWKGSRISVGSTADIVKLTHYKWICNPPVDLNCVYCHSRVCMLIWVCLHSCFPQSLTLLSMLLFDQPYRRPKHTAFLMNVMELSVTYSRYNSPFLVLWDGEINSNSTVLHKHIHTCAKYTHNHMGVLTVPRRG